MLQKWKNILAAVCSKNIEIKFGAESILPAVLVLSKFPAIGRNLCVHVYKINEYETSHCHLLRVRKILKESIIPLTADENSRSGSIECANGSNCSS